MQCGMWNLEFGILNAFQIPNSKFHISAGRTRSGRRRSFRRPSAGSLRRFPRTTATPVARAGRGSTCRGASRPGIRPCARGRAHPTRRDTVRQRPRAGPRPSRGDGREPAGISWWEIRAARYRRDIGPSTRSSRTRGQLHGRAAKGVLGLDSFGSLRTGRTSDEIGSSDMARTSSIVDTRCTVMS